MPHSGPNVSAEYPTYKDKNVEMLQYAIVRNTDSYQCCDELTPDIQSVINEITRKL